MKNCTTFRFSERDWFFMVGKSNDSISFEKYESAARFLKSKVGSPETAIVLGSGLGPLADKVENAVIIPYSDIPGFPVSTVESHAGVLVAGTFAGKSVVVLKGRFHYYEGYGLDVVTFYVRVLKLVGVKNLILTNAAGGVNIGYSVGDLMIITDHIKFFSDSSARGPHMSQFGGRFFDMSRAYTPNLRKIAKKSADNIGLSVHEGVYFFMPGPEFETPAEIRAIRTLGGDVVGMSTVFETVAASQCGIDVLGVSCVTNMAAGIIADSVVSDAEVTENAAVASDKFQRLMTEIISNI